MSQAAVVLVGILCQLTAIWLLEQWYYPQYAVIPRVRNTGRLVWRWLRDNCTGCGERPVQSPTMGNWCGGPEPNVGDPRSPWRRGGGI